MVPSIVRTVALAGGLLLAPILVGQANAGHGGGMGHMGGMGHAHIGGMSGPRFAGSGWHGGPRNYAWNGGHNAWHGNWHGHDHNNFDHNHFVHNRHFHDHFHNNVFIAGIGWWPGYYGYGYGYGGCGWLYQQALYTGSPYWWNRYYVCTGSYY